MNKRALIVSLILATISLTAFGLISRNNSSKEESKTCIMEPVEKLCYQSVAETSENLCIQSCEKASKEIRNSSCVEAEKTLSKQSCAEASDCNSESSSISLVMHTVEPEPEVNLFYDVANRYAHSVIKEDLHAAESIYQILPDYAREKTRLRIASFKSVQVGNDYDNDVFEIGKNEKLTNAQRELILDADYSDYIFVRIESLKKNWDNGNLEKDGIQYFMSVVPAQQAEYKDGNETLISYLKENSKDFVSIIDEDKVEPCRVNFVVTKNGTIEHVELESTSGYSSVDDDLLNLIKAIPGKWKVATNANGDKVDQGLVFFFGNMGC